jgi:hypothetical protein
VTDIPAETALLQAAHEVLESTKSWKPGKIYAKHNVKSFYTPTGSGGTPWHCRVSEHLAEEATFDEIWRKIGGPDKALNEKELVPFLLPLHLKSLQLCYRFIPEVQKATLIKSMSTTQAMWSNYYTFPPPISPRVFTVLQLTHLESDDHGYRTGCVLLWISCHITHI